MRNSNNSEAIWHKISSPIQDGETIPPERKVVLVWLENKHLPFCGYIRQYSNGPFFVVYHGNCDIGSNVVAWCDCLPNTGPDWLESQVFSISQEGYKGPA